MFHVKHHVQKFWAENSACVCEDHKVFQSIFCMCISMLYCGISMPYIPIYYHFPLFGTYFLHILPLFTTKPVFSLKNALEYIRANVSTKGKWFVTAMYTIVYILERVFCVYVLPEYLVVNCGNTHSVFTHVSIYVQ